MAAPMSPEQISENFCFLVVEDFLKRKGMSATLDCFRSEWRPPTEDQVLVSWYEIALKLRLPELIANHSRDITTLENLVNALVRESSVRTRRPIETTLTGLAAMSRTGPSPTIADNTNPITSWTQSPTKRISRGNAFETKAANTKEHSKSTYNKRPTEQLEKFGGKQAAKQSLENWMPEEARLKSLARELSVAKETLEDIQKREVSMFKEMKRLQVTPLQRAKIEESLKATREIPCGCCMKKFLYVNLPLKVSRKAILDIRIKWSGLLSSATVFGSLEESLPSVEGEHNEHIAKAINTLNKHTKSVLGSVPRCYDEVGVCVFCAQFFHVQEEYRPSYAAITYEERKAAFFDTKRREREYWDPLKLIQKDREAREHNKEGAEQSVVLLKQETIEEDM